jgi:hypothetical protein
MFRLFALSVLRLPYLFLLCPIIFALRRIGAMCITVEAWAHRTHDKVQSHAMRFIDRAQADLKLLKEKSNAHRTP